MPSLGTGLNVLIGLAAAPLLPGIIARVKAMVAGRRGPPPLQGYYDLIRLLHKDHLRSRTATWVFGGAPAVGLAAVVCGLLLMPVGRQPAFFSFEGDWMVLLGCLALARWCAILAALDTGSGFAAMGASRDACFSALAEPALFILLAGLARQTGELSLSGMVAGLAPSAGLTDAPGLALLAAALGLALLAENARIPVDDPNTHLELTMIHEALVLEQAGPDLALMLYGAALKLWLFGLLLMNLLVAFADSFAVWCGMILMAAGIGVVESAMARLRLLKVPPLLVGAAALAALGFALIWRTTP